MDTLTGSISIHNLMFGFGKAALSLLLLLPKKRVALYKRVALELHSYVY